MSRKSVIVMKGFKHILIAVILLSTTLLCTQTRAEERLEAIIQNDNQKDEISGNDNHFQSSENITLTTQNQPQTHILSLDDAINLAIENNSLFQIQEKQTQIEGIKALKSSLEYLPELTTSMTYSYNTSIVAVGGETFFVIPGLGPVKFPSIPIEEHWMRQNTITLSQPMTNIYELYYQNKVAKLNFQKALLDLEKEGNTLIYSVYDAYFSILTIKHQLEAIQQNIDELQAIHDLVMARYNEGYVLLKDAQKVEVQLEYARYDLFTRQKELEEAKSYLKKLTRLNFSDQIQIKSAYSQSTDIPSFQDAMEAAIINNPRLKQMGLNIKIARNLKKEQYGAYIPDINFNASYANQSGNDFLPTNNFIFSFNMDFTIFDWTKRELTLKERGLRVDQTRLAYENFIQELKLDVEKKYNNILEARKLIETTSRAVELAENNLDVTSNRYQFGYEIISDVLSDQAELAEARSRYYAALYQEQTAIADLKQVMGILFPEIATK